MEEKLTNTFINKLLPESSRYTVHDTLFRNLLLRVEPSGKKLYYIDCILPNGSRTTRKIGNADILTPAQAREIGQRYIAEMQLTKEDPKEKLIKDISKGITLRHIYEQYQESGGAQFTLDMVRTSFDWLLDIPVSKITLLDVEKWRVKQQNKLKCISINKKTTALKSMLTWALKHKLISENALTDLSPLKTVDSEEITRYLTPEERTRLMAALDAREEKIRRKRSSHNKWLKERHLTEMPLIDGQFADFLKPLILVALNTGFRRNALFSLEWRDVNFTNKVITLRAASAKSKKQAVLPVNDIVICTLAAWEKQLPANSKYVFPSPITGEKLNNCNSAWESLLEDARIKNFRWHDMRHDFASRLVMASVDLNTVRELMTHSDIKTTLRYAHLAPDAKKFAVEKLVDIDTKK